MYVLYTILSHTVSCCAIPGVGLNCNLGGTVGGVTAPGRPQVTPRGPPKPQDGLRWPEDSLKMALNGRQMGQDEPRWPQYGTQTARKTHTINQQGQDNKGTSNQQATSNE